MLRDDLNEVRQVVARLFFADSADLQAGLLRSRLEARHELERLIAEDILQPITGRVRNRQFAAQAILDIVSDGLP